MFDNRTQVAIMPQRIFTPAVITFCILNGLGYAAAIFAPEFVASYGALSTVNIASGKVWTLLTYSIFNSCGFPLVWDLLTIIFLGSSLENKWGAKSWTIFWIVMSVVCGLLYLAVGLIVRNLLVIGAGSCVFGLIGAFGLVFRHSKSFSLFGTVKAHHAVWIMIVIGVVLSLPRPISLISVGGAGVGYCYVKLLWRLGERKTKAATVKVKSAKPGIFCGCGLMDARPYNEIAERIETTREAITRCMLCPRRCGVNRMQGEKGYCKLNWQGYCFRQMVVNYEEEGLNPSHQIYFAGCNLRCDFCSVGEYNEEPCAVCRPVDIVGLAGEIVKQQKKAVRTLNLLGGEPAINLYAILCLLKDLPITTSVVWNSNMYYESIVDTLADGLVDVYLVDLKCGNADCAARLLGAGDYVETAKKRIKDAAAKKKTIVRYLLIPGHFECCARPILSWLASEVKGVKVSIKGDYIPPAESAILPLEYVSEAELDTVVELAAKMGLEMIK